MIDADTVDLSRLQFMLTAMYHFLFVPLTLGLSVLLASMETVYVVTGRQIWRDMTKFWGKLFGINFAVGVATGITMEFQFGTNWAYYSHYVGDIFGAPLAIEGLMAFFLESTFVGLFFFGWDRMSKIGHLTTTWLVAIGSSLSALWILVANGWMQNPVGATFNIDTMRMELNSFYEILFNPAAQGKFVHTVSAGYVTGAMFVVAISAWYLLKRRHVEFAKRSLLIASAFGAVASLTLVFMGDESGFTVAETQPMKMASIEAMWETEPAPAGFTLFGLPDQNEQVTRAKIEIPWVLGIIGTRSLDKEIPGIKELVDKAEVRIKNGLGAVEAIKAVRANRNDLAARETLKAKVGDLGYALLLKRYVDDPTKADAATIRKAALDTIPHVPSLFWSFRLMVGLGFYFIVFFVGFYWLAARDKVSPATNPLLLRLAVLSIPLPWVACELGWFVAEHGRQPWTIEGILPVYLSASSLTPMMVLITIAGFTILYGTLAIVEIFLMLKYIKKGPVEALGFSSKSTAGYRPAIEPAE